MSEVSGLSPELQELKELVGRRMRGLVYIAEGLDVENPDQLADKAWLVGTTSDVCDYSDALLERLRLVEDALREAKLHQGLPEDAPPERVAAHFRANREMREGFDAALDGERSPGIDGKERARRFH